MAGADTQIYTDDTFDAQVLGSSTPVMVDFWAEWCGPCQLAGPIVDQLATDYKGKITIGKLDVDANQKTAAKYGVVSIPTVILFQHGKEVGRKVGFAGRPMYENLLKTATV